MDLKPKKNLLRRVLTFARSEIERLSRPVEQGSEEAPRALQRAAEPPARSEPVRAASKPAPRPVQATEQQPAPSEPAERQGGAERPSQAASEADVRGLEVSRSATEGLLTLRWSISEAEVARAEALIDGSPVLCLRLVSFTKARDDVLRDVQDRPGVERAGECEISEPARGVVSLGLRAGERFVSIAHHVL